MWPWIEKIDISLFHLINISWQNAFFDVWMPFVSNEKNFFAPLATAWLLLMVTGSTPLQYIILKLGKLNLQPLIGLLRRFAFVQAKIKLRTVAVAMLVLLSFSEWISSDILKPAFDRPRPYHVLSHVHVYDRMIKTWAITPELKATVRGESLSLPSSHATNIFAAAFFLSFFYRRFSPLFYFFAFLVGYSRVYLGVHFPFDVFIGSLAGTLCGLLLAGISRHVIKLLEKKQALNEAFNYHSSL